MTNLTCNNCQTIQKARVVETFVPYLTEYAELSRFFLLIIEECKKCKQKKIFQVGLSFLGVFIEFDFMKTKHFKSVESNIIQELDNLPTIKEKNDKGGFYLLYAEYGIKKKCYSNLRMLKLGLDKNLDIDYAKLSTLSTRSKAII